MHILLNRQRVSITGLLHVHGPSYLIPVLLYAPFGSGWEGLCDLGPAVPRVSHILEPQLLRWRPWGIRTALLGRGLHGRRGHDRLAHAGGRGRGGDGSGHDNGSTLSAPLVVPCGGLLRG